MHDNEYVVKDSGARQEWATGSRRDTNDGKPRPDLISPYFQARLGHHLAKGAKKYGARNWEMGQPISRYLESLERHLVQAKMGLQDEDHLSAIAYNAMAIIDHQERIKLGLLPKELDDHYPQKE